MLGIEERDDTRTAGRATGSGSVADGTEYPLLLLVAASVVASRMPRGT